MLTGITSCVKHIKVRKHRILIEPSNLGTWQITCLPHSKRSFLMIRSMKTDIIQKAFGKHLKDYYQPNETRV